MAELEDLEDQVTALRHAMWGVMGDNGVVTDVRELIGKFDRYVAAEQRRRDEDAKEQRNRSRATVTAAVAAVISLIGVIITLVVVLQTAPT